MTLLQQLAQPKRPRCCAQTLQGESCLPGRLQRPKQPKRPAPCTPGSLRPPPSLWPAHAQLSSADGLDLLNAGLARVRGLGQTTCSQEFLNAGHGSNATKSLLTLGAASQTGTACFGWHCST